MTSYAIHDGIVARGFQFASGGAVGRADNPFPAGTLAPQLPYLITRGIDLDLLVPGRVPGTINVKLSRELILARSDLTAPLLDWTEGLVGAARIAAESFSFVHCCLCHDGVYYPGLLYYPHPETKPATNAHHYDVLEVIAPPVAMLKAGDPVSVVCRADAFATRVTLPAN